MDWEYTMYKELEKELKERGLDALAFKREVEVIIGNVHYFIRRWHNEWKVTNTKSNDIRWFLTDRSVIIYLFHMKCEELLHPSKLERLS